MAKLLKKFRREQKTMTPGPPPPPQLAPFDVEGQKIALFNVRKSFLCCGEHLHVIRGGPLIGGR